MTALSLSWQLSKKMSPAVSRSFKIKLVSPVLKATSWAAWKHQKYRISVYDKQISFWPKLKSLKLWRCSFVHTFSLLIIWLKSCGKWSNSFIIFFYSAQTQDTLVRLHLLIGLGMPQCFPDKLEEVTGELAVVPITWPRISGRGRMDGLNLRDIHGGDIVFNVNLQFWE